MYLLWNTKKLKYSAERERERDHGQIFNKWKAHECHLQGNQFTFGFIAMNRKSHIQVTHPGKKVHIMSVYPGVQYLFGFFMYNTLNARYWHFSGSKQPRIHFKEMSQLGKFVQGNNSGVLPEEYLQEEYLVHLASFVAPPNSQRGHFEPFRFFSLTIYCTVFVCRDTPQLYTVFNRRKLEKLSPHFFPDSTPACMASKYLSVRNSTFLSSAVKHRSERDLVEILILVINCWPVKN